VTPAAPQDEGDASGGPPWRIIDTHAHGFPDEVAATAVPRLEAAALWQPVRAFSDGTLAGLEAAMDRAGIDRAVVCSVATRPEQVPKITDWSAAVASERFVPFASIHPDFPEPEAEAERIAAAGLVGLKFHSCYMGCPLDDPRTVRIARAAARAGLAMAFHVGYDLSFEKTDVASPARLMRLREQVPDLRMLACHMGGWECWDQALEHVIGEPMYVEASMTIGRCPPELLERLFLEHPEAYLLFGTDSPWADPKAYVEAFLALPLPEGLKRRALWENALRFLGEATGA
jgi:predicted TIM-barrel fold metal-dependent hydrolase